MAPIGVKRYYTNPCTTLEALHVRYLLHTLSIALLMAPIGVMRICQRLAFGRKAIKTHEEKV